jgi:hypothetical protein
VLYYISDEAKLKRGVFMNVVIIRFEGSTAICRKESKKIVEIEKNLLPLGTEEGDVLSVIGKRISMNFTETRKRKNRIEELFKDILA